MKTELSRSSCPALVRWFRLTCCLASLAILGNRQSLANPPEPLNSPSEKSLVASKQHEWAAFLESDVNSKSSIGLDLILIPPGTFDLGSHETLEQLTKAFPIIGMNARDEAFKNVIESERPKHRVRITHPFYLGKYNVTVGQFRKFVDGAGYKTEPENDGDGGGGYIAGASPPFGKGPQFSWRNTGFNQSDDHPVVNITWNDAMAFCRWLS